MISVEQHIATLLRKHDCVQVPYFGGFVSNSVNAAFAGAHELLPPGKTLSFNRNLSMNDGLLFSHISTAEKMPYYQAINAVQQSVKQWKDTLAEKHNLNLTGIGTFTQETDGRLLFEPEQKILIAASSFGLSALQLLPLGEETTKPQIRKREVYVADKSVSAETTRKKVRGFWIKRVAAAASVTAMLAIAFFVINKNFPQGFNMGAEQTAEISAPKQVKTQPEITTENITEPKIEIPQEANILDKVIEETTAAAEQVFSTQTKFHVIGGSFSSEKNARKFESQLEKKGYSAEILHNENGFYRVTYFTEGDSLVADKLLQKIKTEENQSAWLLKW